MALTIPEVRWTPSILVSASRAAWMISLLPIFEVMTNILFLKLTVLPLPSVSCQKVAAVLKEATTQHSTAMQHSVELLKQLEPLYQIDEEIVQGSRQPGYSARPYYAFATRSDGRSDRHPKNASVQLAYDAQLYFDQILWFLGMDIWTKRKAERCLRHQVGIY
jgi:hypothetical protein